jgi:uridylate kinase
VAENAYKRILLKLSGEALLGEEDYGIDPNIIHRIAEEISEVSRAGIQVVIVIGGGNIFRGAGLAESGIDRVTGDHMGMLATVLNSLALQDAMESVSIDARVMSAVSVHDVCQAFGKRPRGYLRRWHRKSFLHHRYGGRFAGYRSGRGYLAQSDESGWGIFSRSGA